MTESEPQTKRISPFGKAAAVIKSQLVQGLTPHELALALAIGVTVGVMPLVWGTSLLCLILASVLRLNQVVVQIANYLVYPLHFLLYIPYLIGADRLFSPRRLLPELSQLLAMIKNEPGLFFQNFWQVNLFGLGLWLLTTPFICAVIYLAARPCLSRIKVAKEGPHRVSHL